MILDELGIAFIGAIFGSISGFFFAIFWENRKGNKELTKLKKLLSDDYKRLHNIMSEALELINSHLNSTENMEKFVKELISKKFDIKFVVEFHIPLAFNFWKAISDSGSLIKLELDEIKHVHNTYEFINTNSSFIERDYKKWIDVLANKFAFMDELTDVDKKEIFSATVEYFTSAQKTCQDMIRILDEESETFDWIKRS